MQIGLREIWLYGIVDVVGNDPDRSEGKVMDEVSDLRYDLEKQIAELGRDVQDLERQVAYLNSRLSALEECE